MSLTRPPARIMGPRGRSAGLSHAGRVRSHNEDAFLTDDRRGIWAVADGMGGHAAGDVASASVIEHVGHVRIGWASPQDLARDLIARLEDANAALRAYAAEQGARTVGSTVVCLAAFGAHALAVWCGDSRIYRLRPGAGLTRVTRDHTLVQDLVEQGLLSEAEAERHPQAHVLTRAVGAMEPLELDFRQLNLRAGDRFLLCSDGLTRQVDDAAIAQAAADPHADPDRLCETLVDRTLETGAPDNVSVVVVDFA